MAVMEKAGVFRNRISCPQVTDKILQFEQSGKLFAVHRLIGGFAKLLFSEIRRIKQLQELLLLFSGKCGLQPVGDFFRLFMQADIIPHTVGKPCQFLFRCIVSQKELMQNVV